MSDGKKIARVLEIAANAGELQAAQHVAAQRLLKATGIRYPHDGCAITLSVLLQEAGINVPNTFQAILIKRVLQKRGWTVVPIGKQRPGDVGSTCGPSARHGRDHVYLVVKDVNHDEMVIADNQAHAPHFRWASGHGKTPTKFFLRAPAA